MKNINSAVGRFSKKIGPNCVKVFAQFAGRGLPEHWHIDALHLKHGQTSQEQRRREFSPVDLPAQTSRIFINPEHLKPLRQFFETHSLAQHFVSQHFPGHRFPPRPSLRVQIVCLCFKFVFLFHDPQPKKSRRKIIGRLRLKINHPTWQFSN